MHKSGKNSAFIIWVFIWNLLLGTKVLAVTFSPLPLNIPANPPVNILFDLSIEFPTANTGAYYTSNFDSSVAYDGYFDPYKCYHYVFNGWSSWDQSFQGVYLTSAANQFRCNLNGNRAWSGSFLNWLTMSKLDIFRKAMTGGTRMVDAPTWTVLVRTWIDGRGHLTGFPDRSLDATTVQNYTEITPVKPYVIANLSAQNWGMACREKCNKDDTMGDRFRIIDPTNPQEIGNGWIAGNTTVTFPYNIPRLSVVVCNPAISLEPNCKPYYKDSNGVQYYKPTGLIQNYQSFARFSVFSYVPYDTIMERAGGIMRSPFKSIGSSAYQGGNTYGTNNAPEINPATGVFIWDPSGMYSEAPKSDTTNNTFLPIDAIQEWGWKNNGVINYINQFGYRKYGGNVGTGGWHYLEQDGVAELYYESLRYFSLPYNGATQNATPEYLYRLSDNKPFSQLVDDGFPIITNYADPILDKCQKNTVIFLGDANTVCDYRIPGGVQQSGNTHCSTKANVNPSNPIPGLNNQDWINAIQAFEGGAYSDIMGAGNPATCPGTAGSGRGCFQYATSNIAGLSYWAHVNDIRPDLPGFQSVTSYFMDVKEAHGRIQDGAAPYAFGQDLTQYGLAAKYGGFDYKEGDSKNPNASPDSWDGGGGIPKSFLKGDTAQNIQNNLDNVFAQLKNSIIRRSNGSIAISTPINPQNTSVYKAFFSTPAPGQWQGNLISSTPTVSMVNGVLNYNTGTATNFTGGAAGWLKDMNVNGQPRKIISAVSQVAGGDLSGVSFSWDSLGSYVQGLFSVPANEACCVNQKKRQAYIRGDRSNEASTSNPQGLRVRPATVLGDIINSSPVFVGGSQSGYSSSDFPSDAPSFSSFSQSVANRRPMVYVGANDGMLHGFDATTLQEVFAYIPNSVLPKLASFSNPAYVHDYFVDETPIVVEAVIPDRGWTTQLIGFPGMGGTGLFALDITSPDSMRGDVNLSQAEVNANDIFLWELNSQADGDIGHIFNKGQINRQRNGLSMQAGRMADKRWAIVTGNGYNSPNNSTGLIIAYLDKAGGTPEYKKVMIPGVTGGLSTPTTVDTDFDGLIDYAYAGDLNGNLWRFDLRGSSNLWKAFKLFQAQVPGQNVPQPITTAPAVMFHCSQSGHIILFGTGKYFEAADNESSVQNSVYGIWDKLNTTPVNASNLVQQSVVSQTQAAASNTPVSSFLLHSDATVNWNGGQMGWRYNLSSSNRILVPPYVVNDMLYFYEVKPVFPACGEGQLVTTLAAVQACTGQRPNRGVFDTNFDGIVDDNDRISFDGQLGYASEIQLNNDANSIIDASLWIPSSALQCLTPPCGPIQTGFNDYIGLDLQISPPKRASWREVAR